MNKELATRTAKILIIKCKEERINKNSDCTECTMRFECNKYCKFYIPAYKNIDEIIEDIIEIENR